MVDLVGIKKLHNSTNFLKSVVFFVGSGNLAVLKTVESKKSLLQSKQTLLARHQL